MRKRILLTGATDGIGFETAQLLAQKGHALLLHGRNADKLADVKTKLLKIEGADDLETYTADLSDLSQAAALADDVAAAHDHIDVVINNAGVFKTSSPIASNGLDIRFVVNTLAPYILTRRLMPRLRSNSRIVNVSSAAQAPVDIAALKGETQLNDSAAYAQSKLAIMMWTRQLAEELGPAGPIAVSVNPASLLGSKMVKDAYGMDGGDLSIGADILGRAALSDEFTDARGLYYDNDTKAFAQPHPDGLNPAKIGAVVEAINALTTSFIE